MANEDFDITSLAAYLHLTPDQVRKMAERDRLPGRRIGGQWRFSQAEIHEWFEQRIGASDEQELDAVEKVLRRHKNTIEDEQVRIAELLGVESVYLPLLAKTKKSVIQKICDQTAATGKLWDPVKMAEAILSREALHPTALENGVALLHPRRPMTSIVGEPFLALGVTFSGIPFGGPRGVLTDVFFLIGSTSESLHLRVLARLSRLIKQDEMLERLRESRTPDEGWSVVEEFDDLLDQ
ncbi:MAG: PTS sugar transporter subunit IIA [Planctomycetota bacterium]